MCEPSGDQTGKANMASPASARIVTCPIVSTRPSEPSGSTTAIEPDDANGRSGGGAVDRGVGAGAEATGVDGDAFAEPMATFDDGPAADGCGDGTGLAEPRTSHPAATTMAMAATSATIATGPDVVDRGSGGPGSIRSRYAPDGAPDRADVS